MQRAVTTMLGAAILGPTLAACAGGDGPSAGLAPGVSSAPAPTASTSPATTAPGSPTAEPTVGLPALPAFPASTKLQFRRYPRHAQLVFSDVRVAHRHGFDRIVMDFNGTGSPGWSVGYTDRPRYEGSGDDVPIHGDSVLQVVSSGNTAPADGYYSGPRHFRPTSGGTVVDVNVGGTFEGYTQVFAGISGDRAPFRAFALQHPSRLVVDVKPAQS